MMGRPRGTRCRIWPTDRADAQVAGEPCRWTALAPAREGASRVASLTNVASFIAAATILRYPGRYPGSE